MSEPLQISPNIGHNASDMFGIFFKEYSVDLLHAILASLVETAKFITDRHKNFQLLQPLVQVILNQLLPEVTITANYCVYLYTISMILTY